MASALKFIAWLGKQIWKYGKKLPAMLRWANNNKGTIARWLERGFTYGTIADLILRALGL